MQKRLQVTCGVIEKDGRFLIVQRGHSSRYALKWEFPGGKIEVGETLKECMKRELKEELDIDVEVFERLDTVVREYKELTIELIPFRCQVIKGEITLLEHLDMAWIDIEQPIEQELCGGDYIIAEQLKADQLK